jgi:hypothetical protein
LTRSTGCYSNPHPEDLASLRRDEEGLLVSEIHYKKEIQDAMMLQTRKGFSHEVVNCQRGMKNIFGFE